MPPKKASGAKKPAVKKTAAAKAKKVVKPAAPKKAFPAPKKSSPAPEKASASKKKASPAPKKPTAAAASAAAPASPAKKAAGGNVSTIMVEACKQCQCFKKRFEILEKAMKPLKPGLKFVLNAEKPTKGVFIVRTDKGEVLWSMTGLTRPFQPLKAVDFEVVAKELAGKL